MTKVTSFSAGRWEAIDPRFSLAARLGWVFGLLSIVLSVFVGFHISRFSRAAIEHEVGAFYASQAQHIADSIDFRIQSSVNALVFAEAIREAGNFALDGDSDRRLVSAIKANLSDAAWIGIVDAAGKVTSGENGRLENINLAGRLWFDNALRGTTVSQPEQFPDLEKSLEPLAGGKSRRFLFITSTMTDAGGSVVGLIVTCLDINRIDVLPLRAADSLANARPVDIYLLSNTGEPIDQIFDDGDPTDNGLSSDFISAVTASTSAHDYGSKTTEDYLVGFAKSRGYGDFKGTGWTVIVREQKKSAYLPAHKAALTIGLSCLALGLALSVSAALGTRFLLRGLGMIATSANAIRSGAVHEFAEIGGRDEIAVISQSLAALFNDLQHSKDKLADLNRSLDRKVAERTKEIQRLSEETSNAAITRDRLRMARDLHDTLAHSMLALLTQVRMMRKIYKVKPELVEQELEHAEDAAQEGLSLARNAVTELRYFAVRDDGLEQAVRRMIKRLTERAEIEVTFDIDQASAALTGQKIETVYRIIEEALHNVEMHAKARHLAIQVALKRDDPLSHILEVRIEDDGKGFDPTAAVTGHYGIVGMREQADILAAKLEIISIKDRGTQIFLETSL